MKILAIESSAKAACVAVCDDNKLIAQYFQNAGLTHSRTLLKMAEDVLADLNMTMTDIELVAVASGPGSFTGVRIGVSAAIGLAWGADIPVCGVSSLEAMAHHIDEPNTIICPVMDARRGQVYTGLFEYHDGRIRRLGPDRAISATELAEEAVSSGRIYTLLGDGAQLCFEAFVQTGAGCRLASPLLRLQTAWGVACACVYGEKIPPQELTPTYLRVSQAERERLEKASQNNSASPSD